VAGQDGRARGRKANVGASMGGSGIEQVIKTKNGERGVRAGHEGAGLPLITLAKTPHTPMVPSP
jgi:hypothetical protein